MSRPLSCAALVVFGVGLLVCAGFAAPVEFALFVAFGWLFFLGRVVPGATVGWAGVATALACLAGFAAGLHAFLAWLVRATGPAEGPPRRWRPRWTGTAVAVVVLMFVAGLATVGATHQVGWLLTSEQPLFEGGGVRSAARRSQSVNNLKQIGLGVHNFHDADEALPAPRFDREGRPLHGWLTQILPFMEQVPLYNQINLALPWDDPRNAPPFRTAVPSYLNPGVPHPQPQDAAGYALSDYAENARMVGVRSLEEVTDGTSQTILAGEVAGGFRAWGDPVNWRDPARGINRAADGFGGPYKGGANVLFADGSVRFLKDGIDPKVLEALGTPAGRDPVGGDKY